MSGPFVVQTHLLLLTSLLCPGISLARILKLVSFPSLGDLPDPGIETVSPTLTGRFFSTEPAEKMTIYILGNNELKWMGIG